MAFTTLSKNSSVEKSQPDRQKESSIPSPPQPQTQNGASAPRKSLSRATERYLSLFLALLIFFMGAADHARAEFLHQKDYVFGLGSAALSQGHVQYSFLSEMNLNDFAGTPHALFGWPGENPSIPSQILLMRSAVLVRQPITAFQNSQLSDKEAIERFFPHIRVLGETRDTHGVLLRLQTDIPRAARAAAAIKGAPRVAEFSARLIRVVDTTKNNSWNRQVDTLAGVQGRPQAFMILAAQDFNIVFVGSTLVARFYANGPNTIAITDGVYRVKQSTLDSIPFFINFWSALIGQLQEETTKFVTAVNSYAK